MTTQPINADALPYAEGARFITSIYSVLSGIGRFIRSIDQALAAAEASRDLYSPTAFRARADVQDYAARKLLTMISANRPANDDTKIAA